MRGLALFCAGVMENVFLARDSAFLAFLAPDAPFAASGAGASFGQLRWNECLTEVARVRGTGDGGGAGGADDAVLEKARFELDALDAALKRAKDAFDGLASTLGKAADRS